MDELEGRGNTLPTIMEDDPERVALAGAHATDAVALVHAIDAARALYGTMMHGEDDRLALSQRHHLDLRLPARTLLHQRELAAGEIRPGIAEQHGQLERKGVIAVEILMQAVVVARAVFEDERRRSELARAMALREIVVERSREPPRLLQRAAPMIGHRRKPRIDRLAERLGGRGHVTQGTIGS